jgi:ribonuclease Z
MKRPLSFLVLIFILLSFSLTVLAKNTNWQSVFNNNKSLRVIMCGTGVPDIQSQYVRHPSCLAVIGDKQLLLFDAGEGSSQTLGKLNVPTNQLKTIFMTHWHSDHFGGLGQMMNTSWMMGRNAPLNVYGPYGVEQVVTGINQAYQLDGVYRAITNTRWNINNEFMVPHLVNPTKLPDEATSTTLTPVYKKNNLTVSAFLVDHWPVVPALGYQVKFGNCNLVISGDTRIDSSLGFNYSNASVLVSEASSHMAQKNQNLSEYILRSQHSPSALKTSKKQGKATNKFSSLASTLTTKKRAPIVYHSDTWDLAKLAQAAGVKNMVLTHLGPPITTSEAAKEAFTQGMSRYYKGNITVANDGDQFELVSTARGCQFRYIPATDS